MHFLFDQVFNFLVSLPFTLQIESARHLVLLSEYTSLNTSQVPDITVCGE